MKALFSFVMISLLSVASFATEANDCSRTAVRIAKEYSRQAGRLAELSEVDAEKSYLVSYYVLLVDSIRDPQAKAAMTITLMRSDCSPVSIVPHL